MKSLRFIFLLFGLCVAARGATDTVDPVALAYNLKTTVKAYDSVGRKNPRWDKEVQNCLQLYARYISSTNTANTEVPFREFKDALPKVVATGCDDPLFRFLRLQFLTQDGLKAAELAPVAADCANALERSGYPDIRKYYAAVYARDWIRYNGDANHESSNWNDTAAQNLAKSLEDRTMPQWLGDRCIEALWIGYATMNSTIWATYHRMEPALEQNWTNAAFALVAKGRGYLSRAWGERNPDAAGKISPDNWRLMFHDSDVASQAFSAAWKLNPHDVRICNGQMQVELLQGQGAPFFDLWFQRGMQLDASNYDLCSIKLEYLRPRWHGNTNDMIRFGRFCTTNANWGGAVRLMVAAAYDAVAADIPDEEARQQFWTQPEVWSDIHSAFEEFFRLYPNATDFRHNYARYAIWCQKYPEFLQLVGSFPTTNFNYFGGEEQFRQLVNFARSKVGQR